MLTIVINDEQIERRLSEAASASGIDITDLAQQILLREIPTSIVHPSSELTDAEFESLLNSMAVPNSVPIPPDADIRNLAYGN